MVKREIVIVMTKLECTYNLNPFRCVGVFVISVCVVFFLYHTSFVHGYFFYISICALCIFFGKYDFQELSGCNIDFLFP